MSSTITMQVGALLGLLQIHEPRRLAQTVVVFWTRLTSSTAPTVCRWISTVQKRADALTRVGPHEICEGTALEPDLVGAQDLPAGRVRLQNRKLRIYRLKTEESA